MPRKVPRLEALTLKNIQTLMTMEPSLLEYVQKTPVVKSTIQNTRKAVEDKIKQEIVLAQSDIRYNLKRYAHLQLVQAIVTLLFHDGELGSIIELTFPYKLTRMTIWTEMNEKHDTVTTVSFTKRDIEVKQSVFWNKRDLIALLIDTFLSRMPKTISVFRSSLSMSEQPVSTFIREVHDTFGFSIPKRLINTYNRRAVRLSEYAVSPKTISF